MVNLLRIALISLALTLTLLLTVLILAAPHVDTACQVKASRMGSATYEFDPLAEGCRVLTPNGWAVVN
jgi:hypothetical protein